jgi:hypothetical protein
METRRTSRSIKNCDYSSRKHSCNTLAHYTPLGCLMFSFRVTVDMCVVSSNSSPAFHTIASIHPHRARHTHHRRDLCVVCRRYLLPSHFRNHQHRKIFFQCTGKSCNCLIEVKILAKNQQRQKSHMMPQL